MVAPDPVVLITGCSSGIGDACARRLLAAGWTVYATARRPESIASLASAGCRTLALDVCDADSCRAAVQTVEAEHGAVGALVNNAGYGLYGPIEEVNLDEARQQFETNVFGPARLIRLVLPGMRRRGAGRILNMSSMGGRFTFPAGGWYHASKHALEALSDALRFEVRPFGIDVVLVEPGLIRTRFGDTAVETAAEEAEETSAYGDFVTGAQRVITWAYTLPFATGPEPVARAVARALTARRPKTRYRVTFGARASIVSRRLLPDRAWDGVLGTVFPKPVP